VKKPEGKISSSEFDRVAVKVAGETYLGKPFSARREGLSVSDHVMFAAGSLSKRMIFSALCHDAGEEEIAYTLMRAAMKCTAAGKIPKQASLNLSFPQSTEEKLIREQVRALRETADVLKIKLSDIVISRNRSETATLSVSVCAGESILKAESENACFKNAGKDAAESIIMIGSAGCEGAAVLGKRNPEVLEAKYAKSFLETGRFLRECEKLFDEGFLRKLWPYVNYSVAAGEGGIFAALWELSEQTHLGMTADLQSILLDTLTIEICETLDTDPYVLLSGGCMILVSDEPEAAVAVCAEAGVEAAVIGTLEKGNDKKIINNDELRFLEPFREDSLGKAQE